MSIFFMYTNSWNSIKGVLLELKYSLLYNAKTVQQKISFFSEKQKLNHYLNMVSENRSKLCF